MNSMTHSMTHATLQYMGYSSIVQDQLPEWDDQWLLTTTRGAETGGDMSPLL